MVTWYRNWILHLDSEMWSLETCFIIPHKHSSLFSPSAGHMFLNWLGLTIVGHSWRGAKSWPYMALFYLATRVCQERMTYWPLEVILWDTLGGKNALYLSLSASPLTYKKVLLYFATLGFGLVGSVWAQNCVVNTIN